MEQNSPNNNTYDILEDQIRECFGRVTYSHKTHEKCADIALSIHKRIKVLLIILSAIVTTSLLIRIFGNQQWALIVGVILSALSFGLNSYVKDFDLGEISQKHANTANDLWNIRESYLSLLTGIKTNILSIDQITEKRDELQKKVFDIYSRAPRTIPKAYKKAREALKLNEELTFTINEIDELLPDMLKKQK